MRAPIRDFESNLKHQCLQLLRQHELAGEGLLAVADNESDEVPHAVSGDGRGGHHREILLEVHLLPEEGHVQTLGREGREGGREEREEREGGRGREEREEREGGRGGREREEREGGRGKRGREGGREERKYQCLDQARSACWTTAGT